MRICLLANYSGPLDEGMKKTAFYLHKELSNCHEVKLVKIGGVFSLNPWKGVKRFRPHIIHYIPGPSILSFMIMKVLGSFCRAKTVISATHPAFYGRQGLGYGPYYALSSLLQIFIPLLKPDRLLVQSLEVAAMFRKLGCHIEFLPSGVDIEKFILVSPERKQELRQKYGLSQEKFIILHCGSFRKWRNVQVLTQLQRDDTQVIVVGNSTKVEKDIYRELQRNNCLAWKDYVENIEEIYQLADCYVFPTLDKRGSIDLPLSVLEAMACNLPVVSTSFGALPRVFKSGDGFIFAETEEELLRAIDKVRDGDLPARTRQMVLPFSWQNITERLEEIYQDLI